MFCPQCGSKVQDGAVYCPNCGASIGRRAESPSADMGTGSAPSAGPTGKGGKRHRKVAIVIAVVAVVAVVGVVGLLFATGVIGGGRDSHEEATVLSAGYCHTVGIESDGTVVATGDTGEDQCDVSDWEDIVAVSAGGEHTIGLRSDGTVVATGYNKYGQCDVSRWVLKH